MEKFQLKNKHLLSLIVTMTTIVIISTGSSIWGLYQVAFQQESLLLEQQVRSEKELISSVGRFDAMNSRHDHEGGSLGGTLSQVIEAHINHWPKHETGMLLLIETTNNTAEPILISSHNETWYTKKYALNGVDIALPNWAAEFIKKTNDKVSGTAQFDNKLVVYEKLEISTNHFIYIASVDTAEIRAPFITQAVYTLGIALALIVLGSLRFFKTVNPLIARIKSQAELQNSILETANNPIITISAKGEIKSFNKAASLQFGISIEDAIGKDYRILFPDISENFPLQLNDNKQIELLHSSGEISGIKANGSLIPLQASFGQVTLTGNSLFVGVFSDLTDKKKTELALRDNLARTHAIVDTVSDCIITINERGTIQSMNPAGERIFGYLVGEVEGENISILMPENLSEKHTRGIERYLNTNEVSMIGRSTETKGQHKSGKNFPIELSISDVHISGQRMFVGVIRDISQRKEAEFELMQHRDHLKELVELATVEIKAIVQTAVNGIISANEKGTITLFNPAAEELFGWQASEVIGKNVSILMKLENANNHNSFIDRYVNSGKKNIIGTGREVVAVRKDGSEFPAHLAVGHSRLKDHHHLFVAFISDITLQKEAEEQLHKAKESAEAAANAKSNFLANMSHEIRTPMNAIIGFAEVVLQDHGLKEPTREHIQTIYNSGKGLLNIINDVLDFSKVEAGKIVLENVTFHLPNALNDTLRTMQHKAIEKDVKLYLSIDERLTATRLGDPSRLRQIIFNIVGNAIKFTHHGAVSVNVTPHTKKDTIHFNITDTGIGMKPEQVEKVFDSFSQADTSTSRRFGGTGLGTTISKQLVELMGGEIWIESEYGKGSTFHFTAILPESNDLENCLYFNEAYSNDNYISPRCFNILLAEDIQANATLAMLRLEQMGHKVTWVNNGLKALKAMKKAEFDIVLMDIQMPELDGLAATIEIRKLEFESRKHTPIIALTASVMEDERHQCIEAGIDEIIGKPIEFSLLFRTIEKLVPKDKGTANTLVLKPHTLENSFDLIPLSQVADIERAITTWRDAKIYAKALNDFVKNHHNDAVEIKHLINLTPPKINTAHKISHALKGSSSNLYLTEISSLTAELDGLLKKNSNSIKPNLVDDLISAIDKACSAISLVSFDESDSYELETFDNEQVQILLSQLVSSLHELNPESTTPTLNDLKRYLNKDELASITLHINNFDFDHAIDATKTLANKLNTVLED